MARGPWSVVRCPGPEPGPSFASLLPSHCSRFICKYFAMATSACTLYIYFHFYLLFVPFFHCFFCPFFGQASQLPRRAEALQQQNNNGASSADKCAGRTVHAAAWKQYSEAIKWKKIILLKISRSEKWIKTCYLYELYAWNLITFSAKVKKNFILIFRCTLATFC